MKRATALITGATSGIGEALAHLLASKKFSLFLSGRNESKLKKLAQELQLEGVMVEGIISVDLEDRLQRKQLVELIHHKRFDLIINNAGFGIYGDPFSISVHEQLSMLEVNGAACLELTLEAIRAWEAQGRRGIVMNISSVSGDFPCPGMSVYAASKAFVTSFSQSLNTELRSKGMHVLVSCPGMVATDFVHRAARKKVHIRNPRMSPHDAAKQIWKQIEKKQEKHIFNWQYRIGCWIARYIVPVSWTKKMIWNQIQYRL